MNCVTFIVSRLSLALPLVALALPAAAASIPTCVPGSLASYIALDETGGCTVGDLTFFRFSAPATDTTGTPPVATDSQIMVTPVINDVGTGFTFTAIANGTNLFSIPNPIQNQSVTYHINYSLDPAPVETGEDLSFDPPFGNVSATQRYCLFDVFADGCSSGIALQQTITTESPHSFVSFPTPSFFVDVQTDITLVASPGNPAGFDGITSLSSEAPQVPEPTTTFLMSAGVAVLLLFKNRYVSIRKS